MANRTALLRHCQDGVKGLGHFCGADEELVTDALNINTLSDHLFMTSIYLLSGRRAHILGSAARHGASD